MSQRDVGGSAEAALPKDGQWQASATAAANRGERERARQIYQAAMVAFPSDPEPCNQWGILEVKLQQTQKAESLFREAVRRDASFARGFSNLGNVLLEKGDLAEAERAFRRALELNEDLAAAHRGLAALAKRRGDTGTMARELKRADRLMRRQLVGPGWFGTGGLGGSGLSRQPLGRSRPVWPWLVGLVVVLVILAVARG
ncbi:MAG: tetratricopeptide repeat protein [Sulfobacillus sp.]